MGAFGGARTNDLHIVSQMCNPLRHATPCCVQWHAIWNDKHLPNNLNVTVWIIQLMYKLKGSL